MREINKLEEYLNERKKARKKKRNVIIGASAGVILLGGVLAVVLNGSEDATEGVVVQETPIPQELVNVPKAVSLNIEGEFEAGRSLAFLIENPNGKRHKIDLGANKTINIKSNYRYAYTKPGSYQIVFTPSGSEEPIAQTINIQPKREDAASIQAFYRLVNALEESESKSAFAHLKADEAPMFKGGATALMAFIQTHIGEVSGAKGRVLVGFDIMKDGRVKNPNIIEGISDDFDEKVLEAFEGMPNWIPARKNGEAVKTYYKMPFYFSKKTLD